MDIYEQRLVLSSEELCIKSIADLIDEWQLETNYIISNDIIIINFDDREKLNTFYDLLCQIKHNLFVLNECYNL